MKIILEQILILFAFAAVGFLLSKAGVVKKEHSVILSKLLVYVFLSSNIIRTFAKNCTVNYISSNYPLILTSLAIVCVLAVSMHFAAKLFSKDRTERSVLEYSLIIPNFGYMGYALAEELLGPSGLMDGMMFAIPMSLYVYTVGYCILSGKKLSFKNLLNPTMVSLVIGILIGITGLGAHIPSVAYSMLDKASACMAPVSMILTGIVISEFGLTAMLKDPRVYIVSVLRLVVVPAAIGGVLTLIGFKEALPVAVLFYCLPCGLNTVVFVKNAGGNCEQGAGLALVSSILGCLTIPLLLSLFGIQIV